MRNEGRINILKLHRSIISEDYNNREIPYVREHTLHNPTGIVCPSLCASYLGLQPPPANCTDLLVVLIVGLEVVVCGLKPQVDVREIMKPVSPPGRDVIHASRRHHEGKRKSLATAP